MINFIYVIGFTTFITSVVSSVCIFSTGAQIILSKSQHPIVCVAYLLPLTYVSLLFGFLYTMLMPLLFMFGILADVIQYSTFFNKTKYDYLVNKSEVINEEAKVETEHYEAEKKEAEKTEEEDYENETSDEEISKNLLSNEETSDEETDKIKMNKKEFINYVINKCNTDNSEKYEKSSCEIGKNCESCDCSN